MRDVHAAAEFMDPLVSVWLHHDHCQYTRCALTVWHSSSAALCLFLIWNINEVTDTGIGHITDRTSSCINTPLYGYVAK